MADIGLRLLRAQITCIFILIVINYILDKYVLLLSMPDEETILCACT